MLLYDRKTFKDIDWSILPSGISHQSLTTSIPSIIVYFILTVLSSSCTSNSPFSTDRGTGTHKPALPSSPQPYTLPHTETDTMTSQINKTTYVLYISRPRNPDSATKFPVVYALDADYSFALAHNIIEHFTDRGNLPEMYIIGIAYPGASQDQTTYRQNRTRDYTPTHTLEGGYSDEIQQFSGKAPQFLNFIEKELSPYIESRYPVKKDDKTLVGHSYGGLLATYAMLTKPGLFQRYIVVSPSYWYDNQMIFRLEQEFSATHSALPAKLFLCVGGMENPPWTRTPMVRHMQLFAETLHEREYEGLQITSHVFAEETHNSVFPAALSRGLRVVFQ